MSIAVNTGSGERLCRYENNLQGAQDPVLLSSPLVGRDPRALF